MEVNGFGCASSVSMQSALLPDGFASSEWLLLAEAATQTSMGERRILVGTRYSGSSSHLLIRTRGMSS